MVTAAFCPAWGDDFRFHFVLLGVEDVVLDAMLLQNLAQRFGFLDGNRSHQHGPADFVEFPDLFQNRIELFFFRAVNDVGEIVPDHGLVGGDHHDFEFVDGLKLGGFRVRGSSHACKLIVHAEIILKGDARQGLVFVFDLDALFGFQRLMQPVAVTAAGHHAAREFVDDHDLAFLDDVVHFVSEDRVGFERLLCAVQGLDVFGVVQVFDVELAFQFRDAVFRQSGGPGFLVHLVMLFFLQTGHHSVDFVVFVRRFLGGAGNDQRRAGFVDENAVNLVHDRESQGTLDEVFLKKLHVVAQVVEAELVVRAVGDIGLVSQVPLFFGHVLIDHADGQTEKGVDGPHPFAVALGQVIVDRDHVHAFFFERVQINGQRRHQGLSFAGFHLGDLAFVQHHPADQLHIEMAHLQDAPTRFAHHRKGFGQDVIEGGPLRQLLFECGRFGLEFRIAETFDPFLQGVDLLHVLLDALDLAIVFGADDFLN